MTDHEWSLHELQEGVQVEGGQRLPHTGHGAVLGGHGDAVLATVQEPDLRGVWQLVHPEKMYNISLGFMFMAPQEVKMNKNLHQALQDWASSDEDELVLGSVHIGRLHYRSVLWKNTIGRSVQSK